MKCKDCGLTTQKCKVTGLLHRFQMEIEDLEPETKRSLARSIFNGFLKG
jgi:hypothetical protein